MVLIHVCMFPFFSLYQERCYSMISILTFAEILPLSPFLMFLVSSSWTNMLYGYVYVQYAKHVDHKFTHYCFSMTPSEICQ